MDSSIKVWAFSLISIVLVSSSEAFFRNEPEQVLSSRHHVPRPSRQYSNSNYQPASNPSYPDHTEPDHSYGGGESPSITLPNGNTITAVGDGDILIKTKYGVKIITLPDGDTNITVPDGPYTSIDNYGVIRVEVDGTKTTVKADGEVKVVTSYTSSTVKSDDSSTHGSVVVSPEGELVLTNYLSHVSTVVSPDSVVTITNSKTKETTTSYPDGSFIVKTYTGVTIKKDAHGTLTYVDKEDGKMESVRIGDDGTKHHKTQVKIKFNVKSGDNKAISVDGNGTTTFAQTRNGEVETVVISDDKVVGDGAIQVVITLPSKSFYKVDGNMDGTYTVGNSTNFFLTADQKLSLTCTKKDKSTFKVTPNLKEICFPSKAEGPHKVIIHTEDSGVINVHDVSVLDNLGKDALQQSQILSGLSSIVNKGSGGHGQPSHGGKGPKKPTKPANDTDTDTDITTVATATDDTSTDETTTDETTTDETDTTSAPVTAAPTKAPGSHGSKPSKHRPQHVEITEINEAPVNLHNIDVLNNLLYKALAQSQIGSFDSSIVNKGGQFKPAGHNPLGSMIGRASSPQQYRPPGSPIQQQPQQYLAPVYYPQQQQLQQSPIYSYPMSYQQVIPQPIQSQQQQPVQPQQPYYGNQQQYYPNLG